MLVGERLLDPGDADYPELLRHLPDPPARLHMRGRIVRSDRLAVAVVGTRNPNPYGCHMARLIAGDLAAAGVTVVSGLARGIDTAAHASALDRDGRTLAVLGCGLDIDYPRGSTPLKTRIAERGAILSEFDAGTPPLPRNFPSRNRIISGLSLAVVVVQARRGSGSLITARWALDQGREVMAVPGRADDPLSEGTIDLLRDGASPACTARDILDALGIPCDDGKSADSEGRDPGDPLREALARGPCLPEDLAPVLGKPLTRVLSELSVLEIEGSLIRHPGGQFSLRKR